VEIEIRPAKIRSFVPVHVSIHQAATTPSLSVEPQDQDTALQPFYVPVEAGQLVGDYSANFWLRQVGDYKVKVQAGTESQQQLIHVDEQVFLNFGQEFGWFSALFLLVGIGVILWLRRRLRRDESKEKVGYT